MDTFMFYLLLTVIIITGAWACKLLLAMNKYKDKNQSGKRKLKAHTLLACGVLCVVGYILYMAYVFG